MSDGDENPVQAEAATPAPGEPMDLNASLQMVLRKALAHDGLARGLHEVCRAIEQEKAQLCILAENCDNPDYKKLIEALCAEKNVNLISVPDRVVLADWCGLISKDAEGNPKKNPPKLGASCVVVTDYGDHTEGLANLQNYLKTRDP